MKPACAALLLQAAAFPLALATTWLLASAGLPMSYLAVALLQGAIAAGLAWWRGLASWWIAIELLFPLALLGATRLAIPPSVFLVLFLFLLLLYWSTYRTQVPYYPSSRRVWDAVARLLPPAGRVRVIDIGSGLGGLVLDLARRRPGIEATGIELAPLPWLVSALRARLAGSGARFIRGDYEKLDFEQFDVIFAYLSPAAMDALWRKAICEMRPGSMLLSYEFVIDDRLPNRTVYPTEGGPALHIWHF
ncbi:class I SAM-dependent methyltransferase [Massilia yuzhufengensis]|uniref:Methyltransferase domain-containing protein n=1 Tax=Massilia yuzhufengensis TaxID=1164594 RepID=A0A1I1SGI4_9BURK|nr:class I SAM-dependent methyltransferase [Massilia yuzhufengensis]SFD45605.1 Methyltransferase domain-containing protein [Massilia yuzhufengensis]